MIPEQSPPARALNRGADEASLPPPAVFFTPAPIAPYDHFHARRYVTESGSHARNCTMFAVIGNVIAGVLALSLFTATIRLSR